MDFERVIESLETFVGQDSTIRWRIPDYQRRFDWTSSGVYCRQLQEEITNAANLQKQHFGGTILLNRQTS